MSRSRVRIAAIGLGNRTCKYLHYIAEHQDVAELIAVVDIDETRFNQVKETFALSPESCFKTLDELANSGLNVDACIIGTPDICHYEMTLKSLRYGWHVLLEKPMAQTQEECEEIVRVSLETGKLVSICYVLRYHPYFIKLKQLTESPSVGKILSVQHTERVGKDRLSHTFVRGPWNRTEMNTSVFFTKCCHDVDFVLWLIGEDVERIESTSGVKMFTSELAPDGSSSKCIDCPLEESCQYSAVDLYLKRKDWTKGFTALQGECEEDMIRRIINESRYGRCVYHCPENDVTSHQCVNLEMTSGIKAGITMDCTSEESNRITVIECENAIISGDESVIEVTYRNGQPTETYDFEWAKKLKFHAGADLLIIKEFIEAVSEGHLQTRTPSTTSLISHSICFLTEMQ
jgi:hypothetical protein